MRLVWDDIWRFTFSSPFVLGHPLSRGDLAARAHMIASVHSMANVTYLRLQIVDKLCGSEWEKFVEDRFPLGATAVLAGLLRVFFRALVQPSCLAQSLERIADKFASFQSGANFDHGFLAGAWQIALYAQSVGFWSMSSRTNIARSTRALVVCAVCAG
jgi:hypothetical protein